MNTGLLQALGMLDQNQQNPMDMLTSLMQMQQGQAQTNEINTRTQLAQSEQEKLLPLKEEKARREIQQFAVNERQMAQAAALEAWKARQMAHLEAQKAADINDYYDARINTTRDELDYRREGLVQAADQDRLNAIFNAGRIVDPTIQNTLLDTVGVETKPPMSDAEQAFLEIFSAIPEESQSNFMALIQELLREQMQPQQTTLDASRINGPGKF